MRIRRVDIEHFRGINAMTWQVPDRRFLALIGPGDSTKSTVLTAIERALSDRWNVSFLDTDFYDSDLTAPISIRVTVVDLADELIADDVFGRHLCGITEAGDLHHDPEDGHDRCVVIELRVDADLEPQWQFWRPLVDDDSPAEPRQPARASLRARLGVFRVDERVDAHLRWSRMSALGKLTEARHDTRGVLTEASRAARVAVAEHATEELVALADEIQAAAEQLGSTRFGRLRPGLDLSLTNAQGNLALYDEAVPLTNFGLGTRRLAGAATQRLAHAGRALLLIDEVEYGLEPHRLAHLLQQLQVPGGYAQVLVTTHSPTALQHLEAASLVTVRSRAGTTDLRCLADPSELQGVIRSAPAAFLSRRVVVAEGKTEVGLLMAKVSEWDADPSTPVPSAALGVAVVEGGNGSRAITRASHLRDIGYEVVLFIDSDVAADVTAADHFAEQGGLVVRWDDGMNTESAICAELGEDGLSALVELAVELHDDPETAATAVGDQLLSRGAPSTDRDVASWGQAGYGLERAQGIVALAASKGGWFKNIAKARRLGEFLVDRPEVTAGAVADHFEKLRSAIYDPWPFESGAEDATNGDVGEVLAGGDIDAGSSPPDVGPSPNGSATRQ